MMTIFQPAIIKAFKVQKFGGPQIFNTSDMLTTSSNLGAPKFYFLDGAV